MLKKVKMSEEIKSIPVVEKSQEARIKELEENIRYLVVGEEPKKAGRRKKRNSNIQQHQEAEAEVEAKIDDEIKSDTTENYHSPTRPEREIRTPAREGQIATTPYIERKMNALERIEYNLVDFKSHYPSYSEDYHKIDILFQEFFNKDKLYVWENYIKLKIQYERKSNELALVEG